jgi:lysophospholipase L1-like esterase
MRRVPGFNGIVLRVRAALAVCLIAPILCSPKASAQQTGTTPPTTQTPEVKAPEVKAPEVKAPVVKAPVDPLRTDWPNLKRFHDADVALPAPTPDEQRVVFMGDSITEGWTRHGVPPEPPAPGKLYVNRGISGQTTPQMLLRFRQDVIDLKPSAVVIFAGTNDIAGNTGDMTPEQTEENLESMAELAQAHSIPVIFCSILPAFDFPWKPGREPAAKVVALNSWIKTYAASHGYEYVDFYAAMVDDRGGLPAKLSKDGVHPNPDGYAIMTPLVDAGIAKTLAAK